MEERTVGKKSDGLGVGIPVWLIRSYATIKPHRWYTIRQDVGKVGCRSEVLVADVRRIAGDHVSTTMIRLFVKVALC